MEKLYSCQDIAVRYGVKVITVYDWIKKKRIPALKIGKEYRFKESDILEFEELAEKRA